MQIFKGETFYGYPRQAAQINETLYTSVYEQTKDIFENMNPSLEITKGLIAYSKTEDNKADYGLLDIKFFTRDGYCFYFQYILAEDVYDFLYVSQCEYDSYLESSWGDYLVIPMEE